MCDERQGKRQGLEKKKNSRLHQSAVERGGREDVFTLERRAACDGMQGGVVVFNSETRKTRIKNKGDRMVSALSALSKTGFYSPPFLLIRQVGVRVQERLEKSSEISPSFLIFPPLEVPDFPLEKSPCDLIDVFIFALFTGRPPKRRKNKIG